MIEFLRIQYKLGRITEEDLNKLVGKGIITEEDKEYILS